MAAGPYHEDWPRHEEWSAALGARRELGPEYDQAFLENLVDRVSTEIETRVDLRLAEVTKSAPPAPRRRGITMMSLILAIPTTAIAGSVGHVPGLAIAWGGIVLVNVANALRPVDTRRFTPPRPRR